VAVFLPSMVHFRYPCQCHSTNAPYLFILLSNGSGIILHLNMTMIAATTSTTNSTILLVSMVIGQRSKYHFVGSSSSSSSSSSIITVVGIATGYGLWIQIR